ncbi:DUF4112 domain-containing protein [Natrinema ejinorense]|uniref:DUF4112 domain-containing protein n=1 Tax=Natrinema ejinorense TaxID=373386 RepID=A0A2A5QR96_9EURY|nr:DUF4112 domain-containing protein [Natrinema ejinorense]PCR89371.1 hypothetical protein CP557_01740 [Natrinema ejinorense]
MTTDSAAPIRSELESFEGDLPAGVDEAAIKRMHVVARALDEGVRVPGTGFKIGLDPLVGILPGAGDAAAAAVSLYIVVESARMGVSRSTLVRMLANIGVDAVVGSVPLLGVLFDAVWKANKWNLRLALEDLADGSGESQRGSETVTID